MKNFVDFSTAEQIDLINRDQPKVDIEPVAVRDPDGIRTILLMHLQVGTEHLVLNAKQFRELCEGLGQAQQKLMNYQATL